MKDNRYTVISNVELIPDVYEMIIEGDTGEITAPGQFINIKVEGFYLRRPISISDWDEKTMTLIYKIVGEGTKAMAEMQEGDAFYALCPLGNGYVLDIDCRTPMLIGGGLGAAPLFGMAKRMLEKGMAPQAILGFNKKEEIVYRDKLAKLGIATIITTADGSEGIKGFVTDAFDRAEYVYACGPEPMLEAVYEQADDGQFDFGSRMACGFGACMGCSCRTKYGSKRICKDGPILFREEIVW
ncbi:MAG: dihydroorotate dehydrogenase electron transfer subunit [Eubacteriaceae bacterium]|nr:dihydroorotate dehydrogenase electron transfer subunit [Eubacteriaceae bacterium]